MSLSHLNFNTGTNDNAELNEEDVNTRREIHNVKMNEYYDYSKFKNTDDITKVPGSSAYLTPNKASSRNKRKRRRN